MTFSFDTPNEKHKMSEFEKKIKVLKKEKEAVEQRKKEIDNKIAFLEKNHPVRVENDRKLKEIDEKVGFIRDRIKLREADIKDLEQQIIEHRTNIKYLLKQIGEIVKDKCKYQDHDWFYSPDDMGMEGDFVCNFCRLMYRERSKEAKELGLAERLGVK